MRGEALVVGVGNPDRGDDGVGPAVVEELCAADVETLDVGDAPERYLGPMTESGARVLVFVDAVDFGRTAGEAVLLEEADLPQRSCVTHRSSLALVMRYAREQAHQRSVLIGVQPGSMEFGQGLTPAVQAAVKAVAAALSEALGGRSRRPQQESG
ncbi:MAG: hydrogenase maturation protease [Armatimonadota bacterium]|nr:MAG: hydrogenase maturation protease [Armatimonadota bacterium]